MSTEEMNGRRRLLPTEAVEREAKEFPEDRPRRRSRQLTWQAYGWRLGCWK